MAIKTLIYMVPILALGFFFGKTYVTWKFFIGYVARGGSEPFSTFVLENAAHCFVPAGIAVAVLIVIRNRFS